MVVYFQNVEVGGKVHVPCCGFKIIFAKDFGFFFHKCKFLKIVNVETSFFLVTKFEQSKDVFYETFSKKLSSGEIKCISLLISHLLLFPYS